jgi:hypothetical protein
VCQGKSKIDIVLFAIAIFAAFAVGILLLVTVRAPKSIRLAARLGCPNCRSRKLKQTGPASLTCESCGFTFSLGTAEKE